MRTAEEPHCRVPVDLGRIDVTAGDDLLEESLVDVTFELGDEDARRDESRTRETIRRRVRERDRAARGQLADMHSGGAEATAVGSQDVEGDLGASFGQRGRGDVRWWSDRRVRLVAEHDPEPGYAEPSRGRRAPHEEDEGRRD